MQLQRQGLALDADLFGDLDQGGIEHHLTSVYQKLDVANRLELYIYAIKHQLDAALN
ncbi:hypothetical protein GmRootV59_15940 [Variovorax sp. V59]